MYQYAKKFYIDGEWLTPQSVDELAVINPATEQSIGRIIVGEKSDVDRAVSAAKQALDSYSSLSVEQRVDLLKGIAVEMEKKADLLALMMTTEMGAPITFSHEQQVASGLEHLKVMIDILPKFNFTERRGNANIVLEPIGVCALITPWNWPLNQIACKVFPALAAGCTVVLKPSEMTPFSALIFAEILHVAGVPKGVFNLVQGTGDVVGEALSSHPDVDMISITGSTKAGIAVAKSGADTVKRVHQELGGNSPNLILRDAVLDVAVENGLLSVFSNSGQSCDSPARMLLPREKMSQAEEVAKRVAQSLAVGDPEDEDTDIGPLISQQHYDKVQQCIQQAIDGGAKLVTGGLGKPAHLTKGYYCKPTVFSHVDAASSIAKIEIFGPVLLMIPYDDEMQAIQIANDTEYGLAAYIQSTDCLRAQEVARKINCGTVQINYPAYNARVPFGGYKQSGNGREYADFGLKDFLEYKSIIMDA